VSNAEEILRNLRAWRVWELIKGAGESSVPSDDMLLSIVRRNPVTVEELSRISGRHANPAVDAHAYTILRILGVAMSEPAAPTAPASAPSTPPDEEPPDQRSPASNPPVAAPESGAAESGVTPGLDDLVFPTYLPGDEEPLEIKVTPGSVGIRYSWPPSTDGQLVVYRVVKSDTYAPWTPDVGERIAATTALFAVDSTPLDSAVRHATVWANAGRDLADAQSAETTLHAQSDFVLPVTQASLRDDGGVVVGSWITGEAARRVIVLRIPVREARTAGFDRQRYEVCTASTNLTGCTDRTVERGQTYVYRMYVEADVGDGGVKLSEFVEQPVEVVAPLLPVNDLVVSTVLTGDGEHRLDLTWTAPKVGRVVVYRTENGPEAEAERETSLLVSQLEDQVKLPVKSRLTWEVVEDGDVRHMHGVSWPEGWTEACLTPVTIVGDRVRVGKSSTSIRPNPVTMPRLVQRVDWQHLTFGWPAKTHEVKVYVTPRGAPLDAPGQALTSINFEGYEAQGGVRLAGARGLPRIKGGVDVHIVPMTFHRGEVTVGETATVPYNGVVRLYYRLVRGKFGSGRRRSLQVKGDLELGRVPPLALVHLPDRLPLSSHASLVRQFPEVGITRDWSALDEVELPRGGFVRLFMLVPPGYPFDVAILDPPVDELRC